MFEQAIRRTEKKALKLGREQGIQEGMKKIIQDFLKEGLITKEQAKNKINRLTQC